MTRSRCEDHETGGKQNDSVSHNDAKGDERRKRHKRGGEGRRSRDKEEQEASGVQSNRRRGSFGLPYVEYAEISRK